MIDTPPVGFVADMFQLSEIIDTNLFIIRHKYTHKQGLKTALEEVEKHQLKGVGIIVNNISRGKKNYGFSGTMVMDMVMATDMDTAMAMVTGENGKDSKRKRLKVEEKGG